MRTLSALLVLVLGCEREGRMVEASRPSDARAPGDPALESLRLVCLDDGELHVEARLLGLAPAPDIRFQQGGTGEVHPLYASSWDPEASRQLLELRLDPGPVARTGRVSALGCEAILDREVSGAVLLTDLDGAISDCASWGPDRIFDDCDDWSGAFR